MHLWLLHKEKSLYPYLEERKEAKNDTCMSLLDVHILPQKLIFLFVC